VNNKRLCVIITIIFILFVSSVYSQTENGFQGYEWGTSFDTLKAKYKLGSPLPEEKLIEDWFGYDWYEVKTVDSLAGVKLSSLRFGFVDGKFGRLELEYDISEDVSFLEILEAAYGEPIKATLKPATDFYRWGNFQTFRVLVVGARGRPHLGSYTVFSIEYKTLAKKAALKKEEAKKKKASEKAEKAKRDL